MTDNAHSDDTTTPVDDYDSPWKAAVTHAFPEFLAFYFPRAAAAIDWARGYDFLDQELAQVVRDGELGRRLLDRLVRVQTRDGDEQWVYVHIEIQGQRDPDFAERLFVYNYRLYDRYRRPVALLADANPGWKPRGFRYRRFGCHVAIRFPVAKLMDYRARLDDLLTESNPFALVTAAHLLTQQTRGNAPDRYAAKWRLARLLYERDWDRQRIIDLFSVIDWMMALPDALQRHLWNELEQLERTKRMPYITSVERFGIEKGIQQGIQIGEERGEQRGEQRGAANLLLRLIERRFGPPDEATRERIRASDPDTLLNWSERILDAKTLDEVLH
jgi:hypothetical protein